MLAHLFIFLTDGFIYPKNKNNIKIVSKYIDKGRCTTAPWTLYSSSVEWVDRLLVADQILTRSWFLQCGLHPTEQAPAGLCPCPWKEVSLPLAGSESVAFPFMFTHKSCHHLCQKEGPMAPSPTCKESQAIPFFLRGCTESTHPLPRDIWVMHTTHAYACTHTWTNIYTHEWKSKLFFPEWVATTPLP